MVKEGYKQTEAGVIPEEWETISFSDCFDILPNNTLSRAELNYNSGKVKNIHYGDVLIKLPAVLDCERVELPFVNAECLSRVSTVVLQDGDVIIADTAEDETVGKMTEVINVGTQRIVSGLHTIPCRSKQKDLFSPRWLGFFMNHRSYHDQLMPLVTGIKVSSISKNAVSNTMIVVPPKAEQERIAQALSDMDELISSLEKLIEKKKAIREGAMQELLTGKRRLPGFEGEWVSVQIQQVAEVIDPHPSHRAPIEDPYGIPFVGIGDIDSYGMIDREKVRLVPRDIYGEHRQRYNLDDNLIGIGRVASLGKIVRLKKDIGEYVISPTMAVLKFTGINPDFAYYYMLMDSFQEQFSALSNGSTRQSVGVKAFRELYIKIPTTEEQNQLASIFSDIDFEIIKLQSKLDKYRQIKSGMMDELLTGKVRLV